MQAYLDLLQHVLDHGTIKRDRTGVGTRSIFGHQMRFDLAAGFPLLTTKKLHLKSIIHELLWFLTGDTRITYLQQHGVRIWDEWADPDTGDLGPVYGFQWRHWPSPSGGDSGGDCGGNSGGIDQISEVIEQIKTNPDSRRLIVSAWNVADVPRMALPPCHLLFQFYVTPASAPGSEAPAGRGRGRLSCQLYQRSADIFLGVPFNIASYALLTMMVAHVTDLLPGELIHTLGDAHLYLNHVDQAREQLTRVPRPLPGMRIARAVESIFDLRYEDFVLERYDPHPHIKAAVAV